MRVQSWFTGLCLGVLAFASPLNISVVQASPPPVDLGTLGAPLARELQGKPVVVDVYATWCPGCKNIASTIQALRTEYKDKVNFVVLDVTDRSTTQESQERAQKLGLGKYFDANKASTSTVAIIDPATGKILAQFQNNPDKAVYTGVLNTALANK